MTATEAGPRDSVNRSFVHGTYTAYGRRACRCEACCEYQNQRVARARAARLASGRLSHGKRSAYDSGCRCEACKGARRAAYVRLERTGGQP